MTSSKDFVCPCGLKLSFQGVMAGTQNHDYSGTVNEDATVIKLDLGQGSGPWVFRRQ